MTRLVPPLLFISDLFGKDNFFMEIQDQGLPEEHRIHADLMRTGKRAWHPHGGHQ